MKLKSNEYYERYCLAFLTLVQLTKVLGNYVILKLFFMLNFRFLKYENLYI